MARGLGLLGWGPGPLGQVTCCFRVLPSHGPALGAPWHGVSGQQTPGSDPEGCGTFPSPTTMCGLPSRPVLPGSGDAGARLLLSSQRRALGHPSFVPGCGRTDIRDTYRWCRSQSHGLVRLSPSSLPLGHLHPAVTRGAAP